MPRRAPTRRSARSWRSALRPRRSCCAGCAPASSGVFECDLPATELWLESIDIYDAAARLGPQTALLLLHARGDEQIPYTVSEDLHARAREPKRLLVLPGGHHRSLQHDLELQGVSRRFIRSAAAS